MKMSKVKINFPDIELIIVVVKALSFGLRGNIRKHLQSG